MKDEQPPLAERVTFSCAEPWFTLWGAEEEPHVVPGFGPRHRLDMNCWCHPVVDHERYVMPAVSHNVAQ